MKSGDLPRRSYHSPLREKQASDTREAIVAALLEQVSDESLADFSIPKVAERAGVSVRTVYRYFPTREDLLMAVRENWMMEPPFPVPETPEEVPALIPELFEHFERNSSAVMAALHTKLGKEAHSASREPRLRRVRAMIDEMLPDLSEGERRGFFAVARALMSADGWRTMREHIGAEHIDDAAEAASWALGVLLKEIKKKNERARKARGAAPGGPNRKSARKRKKGNAK